MCTGDFRILWSPRFMPCFAMGSLGGGYQCDYRACNGVVRVRRFGLWPLRLWGARCLRRGLAGFLLGGSLVYCFRSQRYGCCSDSAVSCLPLPYWTLSFSNLYGLVIGKVYSSSALAFYNRGRALPQTGVDMVKASVANVTFSAFSSLQNDRQQLR